MSTNKKLVGSILLAFISFIPLTLMAGCSEKFSQQSVITAEALLATLETTAYQYEQGDFGTPDKNIVDEIKALDQIAYADIKQIRTSAASGTTLKTSEKVAAIAAVTALESYLVNHHILNTNLSVTTDNIVSSK